MGDSVELQSAYKRLALARLAYMDQMGDDQALAERTPRG